MTVCTRFWFAEFVTCSGKVLVLVLQADMQTQIFRLVETEAGGRRPLKLSQQLYPVFKHLICFIATTRLTVNYSN